MTMKMLYKALGYDHCLRGKGTRGQGGIYVADSSVEESAKMKRPSLTLRLKGRVFSSKNGLVSR